MRTSFQLWNLANRNVLDESKINKKDVLYQADPIFKNKSVRMPSIKSNQKEVEMYYEKVSNLVKYFNQNDAHEYDQFLINEVLDDKNHIRDIWIHGEQ